MVAPRFHPLLLRSRRLSSSTSALSRLVPRTPRLNSTASASQARRPSIFRSTLTFIGGGIVFTTLGFYMAASPAIPVLRGLMHPPSDADTLQLFSPSDPEVVTIEEAISSHPLTASLRADPSFTESRPHLKIPPAMRHHNLTAGTLSGAGLVTVPPFAFADGKGESYVLIAHLGTDLCGHPGIVHGGLLATLLDEGLAWCCFAALPHRIGMTANLNINYKAPARAGSYVVLRASTTKVEGRKAWVKGRLETLVADGEEPVVLAEAEALYISPKGAGGFVRALTVT